MAHFLVEYSANLSAEELDLPDLFAKMHRLAVDSGVFPEGGLRMRALCCNDFWVADGAAEKGFVHLGIRMGSGRELAVREALGRDLIALLSEHLKDARAQRSIALSLEMRELASVKFNDRNF